MNHPSNATAFAFLAAAALVVPTASAQVSVFMDGLQNPRGLTFDGDTLYVTEAGSGGATFVFTNPGTNTDQYYGTTGQISSKTIGGTQAVLLQGLPSLADQAGAGATGPHDIAVGPDGTLYATLGLGANPAVRGEAPLAGLPSSNLLGHVVAINPSTLAVTPVLDVSGYEAASNPDGGAVDSNPFGLLVGGLAGSETFVASDAGGNSVLFTTASGVNGVAVLPASPNNTGVGPPMIQAVATGLATTLGGEVLAANLSGFPFPQGGANLWSVEPGSASVYADGLTYLTDVAVADDGTVYALSLDLDGEFGPGTTGGILRINGDDSTTLILDGLVAPTGLVVGPDDALYVSNFGPVPGGAGQVLRVVVPEPGMATGLLATAGLLLRRRR